MAAGPSLVVDGARRKPPMPIRPNAQAPSRRPSTCRPPSAVSETRKMRPRPVRYTAEDPTTTVYLRGRGAGSGNEERGPCWHEPLRPFIDRSGHRTHVGRLWTFRSLRHVELDLLVLLQVLVALARDRA